MFCKLETEFIDLCCRLGYRDDLFFVFPSEPREGGAVGEVIMHSGAAWFTRDNTRFWSMTHGAGHSALYLYLKIRVCNGPIVKRHLNMLPLNKATLKLRIALHIDLYQIVSVVSVVSLKYSLMLKYKKNQLRKLDTQILGIAIKPDLIQPTNIAQKSAFNKHRHI